MVEQEKKKMIKHGSFGIVNKIIIINTNLKLKNYLRVNFENQLIIIKILVENLINIST